MIFLAYRGKVSEKFESLLRKIKAPVKVVFVLKKLKTLLPSLKPNVEKPYKSGVVYKIECPRCKACYGRQTSRHLIHRIKEHRRSVPVANHFTSCGNELNFDDNVSILCSYSKSNHHLMILEALMINKLKPSLNTKDEYRSRSLVIKI